MDEIRTIGGARNGSPLLAVLAGIGLGAAVMYFLDPNRGARRRHLLADKTRHNFRVAGRGLHDAAENARNHARGRITEVRQRFTANEVDDDRLVDRVRAALGHRVERARAIEVVAEEGCVTLTGVLPADQITRAEKTVASVRGVLGVNNALIAGEANGRNFRRELFEERSPLNEEA